MMQVQVAENHRVVEIEKPAAGIDPLKDLAPPITPEVRDAALRVIAVTKEQSRAAHREKKFGEFQEAKEMESILGRRTQNNAERLTRWRTNSRTTKAAAS